MIKNLLYSAACSIDQNQRNYSIQALNAEYKSNTQRTLQQLFQILCSDDKTDHILSYTFIKKIINQSTKQKLSNLNNSFEQAFFYWYNRNLNRNTFQEIKFQKQNIIQLNALYLALNSSGKYRQDLIDVIPFKISQLYNKQNKQLLFGYLQYYGEVLKNLRKYRTGYIHSRKAAMGSVMLLKVTSNLQPQDSFQASLWLNFIIHFSNFNSWSPNGNFLIKCIIQYRISKESMMALFQYLSTNFKIKWTLEQQCNILKGLNDQMSICEQQINSYKCIDVEKILKCLKTFLHNFFISDKSVSHTGQAMIVAFIYSFQQFEKIGSFIINMISHFSCNNQNQTMGNLSQMIVQYSTQILRLYSNYLNEQDLHSYTSRFMQNLNAKEDVNKYEKIFIFFSSLPKQLLELFGYEKAIELILQRTISLSQKFQPIYLNFLNHYLSINQYLDLTVIQKIAQFLMTLVNNRQQSLGFDNQENGSINDQLTRKIQRLCLSFYSLSKLSKYKNFTLHNKNYFQYLCKQIFQYLFKSKNEFSILIEAIGQLIKQNNFEWNLAICSKCIKGLIFINQISSTTQRISFNQLEIQLYRIMKKTFQLNQILHQISNQMMMNNSYNKLQVQNWLQISHIILLNNLQAKSPAVKQQIMFMIEQILVQINRILYKNQFQNLQQLLMNLLKNLIRNQLFEYINSILYENSQGSKIQLNNDQILQRIQFAGQQYGINDYSNIKQLYLCSIRILLELSIHQQYLQMIYVIIQKYSQKQLYCIWQALQLIYPGKINLNVFPQKVRQRIQKITTGNIFQLFQNMNLNSQQINIIKETPSWNKLYKNILREDSIVNVMMQQKIAKNL